MTNKVAALITAEAIIAGFMISYATLVGQMLIYWSEHGGSLFTTFQAGLLATAVVLTCFRSIFVLYRFIHSTQTNTADYEEGYAMFVAALILSGIYAVLNLLSIYHFTLRPKPIEPTPSWDFVSSFVPSFAPYLAELTLFFFYLVILLHKPKLVKKSVKWLSQGRSRNAAEILGWIGVVLLVAAFLLNWF